MNDSELISAKEENNLNFSKPGEKRDSTCIDKKTLLIKIIKIKNTTRVDSVKAFRSMRNIRTRILAPELGGAL